jgi:hypothetical protein
LREHHRTEHVLDTIPLDPPSGRAASTTTNPSPAGGGP